jgi:hypothetical protein
VGDALGEGDDAAEIVPATAKIRKIKEEPREYMARNVQTYVSASTAKAFEIGVCVTFRLASEMRYSRVGAAIVMDAARK